MGFFEILTIGLALSMDACAVGMTNGMTDSKMSWKKTLLVAGFFGFFQFLMPLIGYFVTGVIANAFLGTFQKISAWVSFALLAFLGGKMLVDCIRGWVVAKKTPKETICDIHSDSPACRGQESVGSVTVGKLFLQAIATSIDALAVGVTLQMAQISAGGLSLGVWGSTLLIGCTTFLLSVCAVYIGKAIGDRLADKATLLGGLVLIAIGVKILLG